MATKSKAAAPATVEKSLADLERTVTVGDAVLEATVERAFKFLRGVGTSEPIRAALAKVGYGAEEHDAGWRYAHAVSGYQRPVAAEPTKAIADAIAAIDAADEELFAISAATLKHRFPAQEKILFANLSATRGPGAVVGMKTYLDRLTALETSADADDQAAVALLAKRGITPARRAELAALVATAESYEAPAADVPAEDNRENLLRLRAWYEEWSGVARSIIKRRDHLIRLGLAQRRTASSIDDGEDPVV
jgi:hypothetical protein